MKVTLERKESIADNIYTFWFAPEKNIRYIAGQFIELRIHHDEKDKRGDKRWFTLSSSPTEPLVSITTKFPRDNPSSFKKKLRDLEAGEQVDMSSPMGDFVLPKNSDLPILFVAGGIGCTPFRSILKNLYDTKEQRNIKFIYGLKKAQELAFKDLFTKLGPKNFFPIISEPSNGWNGSTGSLNTDTILRQVEDKENTLIYLSGPEPMTETLFKELKNDGFNKKHIYTDYFPGYVEI